MIVTLVLISFFMGALAGPAGWRLYDAYKAWEYRKLRELDRIDYEEWSAKFPTDLYNEKYDWYVEGPHATLNRNEAMKRLGHWPPPVRRVRVK